MIAVATLCRHQAFTNGDVRLGTPRHSAAVTAIWVSRLSPTMAIACNTDTISCRRASSPELAIRRVSPASAGSSEISFATSLKETFSSATRAISRRATGEKTGRRFRSWLTTAPAGVAW